MGSEEKELQARNSELQTKYECLLVTSCKKSDMIEARANQVFDLEKRNAELEKLSTTMAGEIGSLISKLPDLEKRNDALELRQKRDEMTIFQFEQKLKTVEEALAAVMKEKSTYCPRCHEGMYP